MTAMMSMEIRRASRPKGIPTADNFALARTELEPLKNKQVLVRNLFMSVDPYMRGRMNNGKTYVPQFELSKPLEGGAVGEVIESRARELKPGDPVASNFGWREYFIAPPKELHPVSQQPALEIWSGEEANVKAAQQALLHRARCNRAARRGEYAAAMETR